MPRRRAGRPSLLTKTLQTKFCRAIARGQSMRAAAEVVGIGQSTAEEWHRRAGAVCTGTPVSRAGSSRASSP